VISKRFAKDPKAVARFVLEAKSVNQIGHHNIVDIFSIGVLDDGRNFLIMELLDGLGLHHVLANLKRLRPGEVLPVYEQACDALEAAHNKGFIHRDLKPDNIIVLRRPPYPFIKILDFGLAKLRGSAMSHNTEVGTVLGTPEYMAPEQCRGAAVDARTDIYAMGVMLYELVTGRKPFTDPSPLRILAMQQRNAPLPPSRIAPIPKMLELVVLKAMAKDPAQRHSSARALLSELRRAIPEPLTWTAAHLSTVNQQEDLLRTSPPDELEGPRAQVSIPGKVEALQPVSISGEMTPLTGETDVEDDNVKTLVSERYDAPARPQPPVPISGELRPRDVEDVANTEVDPVEEKPAHRHATKPPTFITPSYGQVSDMAQDTRVDDQGPAVLVDRPIHEVGTSDIVLPKRPPEPDAPQRAAADAKAPDALTALAREALAAHAPSVPPDAIPLPKRPPTPADALPTIPLTSRAGDIALHRGASEGREQGDIAMGKTIPMTSLTGVSEGREGRKTGPELQATGRQRRMTGPRPIEVPRPAEPPRPPEPRPADAARGAGTARKEPPKPLPPRRSLSWPRLVAVVLAVLVAAIAIAAIIRRFT
jgi:serine/threonine-protein kinase